jgi:Icc-related predicted phosphoesterase
VLGELFGAEAVGRFVALRTARRYDEARDFTRSLWATVDDREAAVAALVRKQYQEMFDAFPDPTYVTYGNVDLPTIWPEFARPGVRVLDGEVVELGGWRFGFVGGGLPSPMRTPFEVPPEVYAAKIAALGRVDVLCSHIPPAVPELLYDTVARRFERGSSDLLAAIRATQPRYALFGHVHQPLQERVRIGRTECVNVGHFRATGRPWVLSWGR